MKLRYLGHAGIARHNDYTFYGHGSIAEVADADAPEMLALTWEGGGCCGTPPTGPLPVFAPVDSGQADNSLDDR